ncbi:hypothetical protein [Tessaracoccus sp. OH4464_COT-324]|uniref:hypothetical protein n=1 Tax=Tessaracoccus sp. OH4464_COT-324 TaxID=2491059 RepID=UPI000F641800|nr:hypothetical protein [Tessaracoccus sp. OH4464_COT-324]RRD45727.1 hypothetical protein EII42_10415 [Tessaracoccus sp. OH4464_COT-324]
MIEEPEDLQTFESDDLDGHTVEDLAQYLDSGRQPRNEAIERSPACQLALESLERLRRLTTEMVQEDEACGEADESWVNWIISGIALDARAGRRIPYRTPEPHELSITEGAVRGLIRQIEVRLPGVVIGRCKLMGDVESLGAPVTVVVETCLPFGRPIPELASQLRGQILASLAEHTDLSVSAVDIVVTDIQTDRREEVAG